MAYNYVRERNKLIPKAWDVATAAFPPDQERVGKNDTDYSGDQGAKWNGLFMATMERLWAERKAELMAEQEANHV